jgi:nucleotide-binding universal stress UspA family protein
MKTILWATELSPHAHDAGGKRSLEALLLGSTVERVTRHADCPVMVVR